MWSICDPEGTRENVGLERRSDISMAEGSDAEAAVDERTRVAIVTPLGRGCAASLERIWLKGISSFGSTDLGSAVPAKCDENGQVHNSVRYACGER